MLAFSFLLTTFNGFFETFSVKIYSDFKVFMAIPAKILTLQYLRKCNFQKFAFTSFSHYKMKVIAYCRQVWLLVPIFKVNFAF